MKSLTHYCQVLAVVPPVTPQRLKRAYRNAVKIWHPDRFAYNSELQNTAQEKLEEIMMYVVAIKEATEEAAAGELNEEEDGGGQAVVKSWLESAQA